VQPHAAPIVLVGQENRTITVVNFALPKTAETMYIEAHDDMLTSGIGPAM
jgi:hypothetical protein